MANKQKLSWFLKAMLFLGLAFLYIPLIVLVVYSFNDSKLVTIWGGFSTKWYAKLLNNDQILEAAWLSLRIAVISSLAATVLGTLAGYALARIKRFRGSTLFAGMVSAPMVMPDVITGLSMLLLIIQVQTMLQGIFGNTSSFGNGFFTIFLGHATLCMAYITVVIRARLAELDQSLEEAAMDLGARPPRGQAVYDGAGNNTGGDCGEAAAEKHQGGELGGAVHRYHHEGDGDERHCV